MDESRDKILAHILDEPNHVAAATSSAEKVRGLPFLPQKHLVCGEVGL